MPWNKPGRSNPDDHDNPTPWERKKQEKSPQSPPDLQALLCQGGKWIGDRLRLHSSVSSKQDVRGTLTHRYGLIVILLGVFVFFELAWGIIIVDTHEQVLITRFGQYQRTLASGYHWIVRPIEQAIRIPLKNQSLMEQSHLILADQNPVSISVNLTYSITQPIDYALNTARPLDHLQQTVRTVIYQRISPLSFNALLELDRTQVAEQLKSAINTRLRAANSGILITQVVLNPLDIPAELKTAFDEVNTARANQLKMENEAKTNALQLKLQTQGEAKRLIEEAKTYQQAVISKAKNEVVSFLEQLPSYKLLPKLTQQRLYFEALQTMIPYSHTLLITGSNAFPPMKWILTDPDERITQLKATNPAHDTKTASTEQSALTTQSKTSELPSVYATAEDYDSKGGYDDHAQ